MSHLPGKRGRQRSIKQNGLFISISWGCLQDLVSDYVQCFTQHWVLG